MIEIWNALGICFWLLGVTCFFSSLWIGRKQKERNSKRLEKKCDCENTAVLLKDWEDQLWIETKES